LPRHHLKHSANLQMDRRLHWGLPAGNAIAQIHMEHSQ